MRIRLFLMVVCFGIFHKASAGFCAEISFEEKTSSASLIFSGRLIWNTENNGIPDSLLFVATDVWKGRYQEGDTIFILNDLNGGGIMNVKDEEEYLIYARYNMIMPCAGSRPSWSTTETDMLDYKFRKLENPVPVLINGIRFTKRESDRLAAIFRLSDLSIPDTLKPAEPNILFGEKKISLKSLSQMNFDEPVVLIQKEGNNKNNKELFILQLLNTTKKKRLTDLFRRKSNKT